MMSDLGTGTDDVLYRLEDITKEFLGLQDDEISDIMAEVFQSVENVEKEMD